VAHWFLMFVFLVPFATRHGIRLLETLAVDVP